MTEIEKEAQKSAEYWKARWQIENTEYWNESTLRARAERGLFIALCLILFLLIGVIVVMITHPFPVQP